ncbi:MAG: RNA 2'-phosphotransferase [Candidatus Latescibacteria bacterium]|nr:RNA 2'-phosphotransferase [Candidatus Latescibacterota bacterium]
MSNASQIHLSKLLSLILRHRPEDFHIAIDQYGFANIEDILRILQERLPWVTRDDINDVVYHSEKQRFEIIGEKVRARYGHSFPVQIDMPPIVPPEFLYQAVVSETVEKILQHGLSPQDRQYVHLSLSSQIADELGQRIGFDYVILRILAQQAASEGNVRFFEAGPVILTEFVPPEFIETVKQSNPSPFQGTYGRKLKRRKQR